MWERIKSLLGEKDRAKESAVPAPSASPSLFHRFYKYPDVFEFNMSKLDLNLLTYPDIGHRADRDIVLLLIYGYEEIFRVSDVNEAFICRKLGEIKGRARVGGGSFDDVYAQTRQFDVHTVTEACVRDGDLERTDVEAGGSLKLTPASRQRIVDLALALDRRGVPTLPTEKEG